MRTNERIRVREVRLIDEEGNQVGIVETRQAQQMAREKNLDLIEVAPNASPPVCRIMDYGKYKYEQSKRDKEAKKKSKVTEIKGVRIKTPRIGDHDYDVRVRDAIRFLKEGDKVKVSVILKSREITHPEIARELLNRLAQEVEEFGALEKPPSLEARTMSMILSPRPEKVEKKEAAAPRKESSSEDGAAPPVRTPAPPEASPAPV